MQPTLMANTWMAAHLPCERYLALLCCAGTAGQEAFHNSLDGAFVEAGYQHLPTTLNRRRPPTYQFNGRTRDGLKPVQRVVRKPSSIGRIKFHDVLVLGNAATMTLSLDAVVVDMSALKDVKELCSEFMYGCTSLTSITLPPNVEVLGERALGGCSSLVSLDMSALKNMKTLPFCFMRSCTSLTSITLPSQVEDLGFAAFSGCSSLASVDMSALKNLKKLPNRFMYGCTSLTSITLPPQVTDIQLLDRPRVVSCVE